MLVKNEVTLTPTSELTFNRAYWTGSAADFLSTNSSLDPIPEFNDYLNTARVKPPPRPRIPTGSRRANCRVNRARLNNRGGSTSGRPGNRRQTSHSSPIVGNCDISKAVLEAKRGYDSARAKIIRETTEGSTERQSRLTALDTSSAFVRDIRAAYAADPSSFTNDSERKRFTELRSRFQRPEELISATQVDTEFVNNHIGELDNATEAASAPPTTAPPPPSTNSSPGAQ